MGRLRPWRRSSRGARQVRQRHDPADVFHLFKIHHGFVRTSKSVQLTPAGAAFLVEAREILARVARAGEVVQMEKLQGRQLHAAFVHGTSAPGQLKALPLVNDVFMLCLYKHHPLAGRASIDLRELADEAFVMFSRDTRRPTTTTSSRSSVAPASIRVSCTGRGSG